MNAPPSDKLYRLIDEGQSSKKPAMDERKEYVDHSYTDYSHVPLDTSLEEGQLIATKNRKKRRNTGSNFPAKLYQILCRNDCSHIIAWQPHGRSWHILNSSAFVEMITPMYFNQTKLQSFMRQLSGLGFKRLTHGLDKNSYYHQLFLRGRPHLTQFMRRTDKNSGRLLPNPNDEPDFRKMPECSPLPENSHLYLHQRGDLSSVNANIPKLPIFGLHPKGAQAEESKKSQKLHMPFTSQVNGAELLELPKEEMEKLHRSQPWFPHQLNAPAAVPSYSSSSSLTTLQKEQIRIAQEIAHSDRVTPNSVKNQQPRDITRRKKFGHYVRTASEDVGLTTLHSNEDGSSIRNPYTTQNPQFSLPGIGSMLTHELPPITHELRHQQGSLPQQIYKRLGTASIKIHAGGMFGLQPLPSVDNSKVCCLPVHIFTEQQFSLDDIQGECTQTSTTAPKKSFHEATNVTQSFASKEVRRSNDRTEDFPMEGSIQENLPAESFLPSVVENSIDLPTIPMMDCTIDDNFDIDRIF